MRPKSAEPHESVLAGTSLPQHTPDHVDRLQSTVPLAFAAHHVQQLRPSAKESTVPLEKLRRPLIRIYLAS
jgi:hypothetical protein